MKTNFGEILQTALDRRNLSQRKAASMLHISPQALNSYIKNKRFPDIETMQYILQHFQLDANNVLQIKLEQPRECVSDKEQRLLHIFRNINDLQQDTLISISEIIEKNLR